MDSSELKSGLNDLQASLNQILERVFLMFHQKKID